MKGALRQRGLGGEARRGGFPRKVKGGDLLAERRAAPARVLLALLLLSGRLHQKLPPPATLTHAVLASLTLTSARSAAEGRESNQSFSYWGTRRPCASMARDGLAVPANHPRLACRRLPSCAPAL